MATTVGKRLRCETCGSEVIVTRSGQGPVRCHEQDMSGQ